MIRFSKPLTKRVVARMLALGIGEDDIVKIFSLHTATALIETLKDYRSVSVKITPQCFFRKINVKEGWGSYQDRRIIVGEIITKLTHF